MRKLEFCVTTVVFLMATLSQANLQCKNMFSPNKIAVKNSIDTTAYYLAEISMPKVVLNRINEKNSEDMLYHSNQYDYEVQTSGFSEKSKERTMWKIQKRYLIKEFLNNYKFELYGQTEKKAYEMLLIDWSYNQYSMGNNIYLVHQGGLYDLKYYIGLDGSIYANIYLETNRATDVGTKSEFYESVTGYLLVEAKVDRKTGVHTFTRVLRSTMHDDIGPFVY